MNRESNYQLPIASLAISEIKKSYFQNRWSIRFVETQVFSVAQSYKSAAGLLGRVARGFARDATQ